MSSLLADLSQQVLAEAVEANMAQQFAYFAHSPQADVDDGPELLRYFSGIPIPEYNGAMRARFPTNLPTGALADRIQAVIAWFAAQRQPFYWWIGPSGFPTDLGERLAAAGLMHLGDGPGMAADLQALNTDQPALPGLIIHRVSDVRTLRDWAKVASAGYGEPEAIVRARYDVHLDLGLGADLPLQRYVAYLDGQPVAMSALFLGAGVAGIYDVATAKHTRRRGIGAAITRAPLRRSQELGYRIGVLQASEMGKSLYAQLGFRQVCAFSLYSWEPGV